ncbi:hypothetical protein C8R45DRAFT_1104721 [Mycena sanguinolenta]|nr:hypothetical protein C8R45DRAFT_1104721 [Mycena sanguinolenta]
MANNVTIRSPSPSTHPCACVRVTHPAVTLRADAHRRPPHPTSLSPPRSHPLILLLAPLGVPSTDVFVSQTYRAPPVPPGTHRPPRLDRPPSPESEQVGGSASV